MADLDVVSLQVDGGQVERIAEAVSKALGKINAKIADLNEYTEIFNKKGKLTEVVFRGITEAGEKFAGSMADLDKGFSSVDLTAKKTTKSLSLYEQGLKKAEDAAKAEAIAAKELGVEIAANLALRDKATKSIKEGLKAADKKKELEEEKELRTEIAANLALRERAVKSIKEGLAASDKKKELEREKELRTEIAANIALREKAIKSLKEGLAAAKKKEEIEKEKELRTEIAANIALRERAIKSLKAGLAADTARRRAEAEREYRIELEANIAEMERLGKAGKKSAQDVLISWQSVARLFAVQLLHQGISLLRTQLTEAARESIEYGKTLAEIRTIAEDLTATTRDWSEALFEVGQNTPFDQLDVAQAAYQALSDQIIHTTDDLRFLRVATDLALVGVSDLETAVDILSSSINSFGLSTFRTNQIAAELFKAVDLGRARLDELAENYGRISILSSQLGVSFRDQNAALAALSIQGLQDNVAKTLLVNVYNKLIRPSERLSEIYAEWGVSSGTAAVAAFGLAGVMQRLQEVAKEGGDEVAELAEIFQRVRALTGGLGLDFEKLQETMDGFGNTAEDYDRALQTVQEATSTRLRAEFADVDRLFLRFGEQINTGIVKISDIFGGLDNAILTVGARIIDLAGVFLVVQGTKGVLGIINIFDDMRKKILLAGQAATSLSTLMGQIWVPVVALGTVAILELIQYQLRWRERVQASVDEALEAWNKYYDDLEERSREWNAAILKEADDYESAITRALASSLAEIRRINNSLAVDLKDTLKEVKELAEDFAESTIDSVGKQTEALKDNLQDVVDKLREVQNELKRANERVPELQEQIEIDRIKLNQNNKPLGAVGDALFALGTEDALKEAQQIFQEIAKNQDFTNQEREQAAKRIRDIEIELLLLKDAELAKLQQQIKDNEKLAETLQKQRDELEAKKEAEEAAANAFKDSIGELQDFDLDAQRTRLNRKLGPTDNEVEREIQLLALLNDQLDQIYENIRQTAIDAGANPTAFLERIADLQVKIEEDTQNRIAEIKAKAVQAETAAQLEAIKARKEAAATEVDEAINAIRKTQGASQEALQRLRAFLEETKPKVQGPEDFATAGILAQYDEIITKIEQINDLEKRAGRAETEEEVNRLLAERADLLARIGSSIDSGQIPGLLPGTDVGNGESIAQLAGTLRSAGSDLREALEKQARAETALAETKTELGRVLERLKDLGLYTEVQLEEQRRNTQTMQELSDNVIAAATLLAELLEEQRQRRASTPETEQTRFFGGLINGPSGIDRVNARLSHGEFVVNAAATRANLPILQAINSGQTPAYRNGGRMQNINFGDINITGGSSDRVTANALVREINRQVARGTLKWNN